MIARRAQPGLLVSAAIVRALCASGATSPRMRLSPASMSFTAGGRLPGQLEMAAEQLFRVVKLTAGAVGRRCAGSPVAGGVDLKFRLRGPGHLGGVHVPGTVRCSGVVGGEPPQQPLRGRSGAGNTQIA